MSLKPFRADIVGSFLRPPALKKAREEFKNGKITREALTEVEHAEIKRLVELEVKHGLKAVTDGEFPRGLWHVDFFLGLKGYTPFRIPGGLKFSHTTTRDDGYFVTGKVEFNPDHPFFDHFKYLKSVTPEGVLAKVCIPSPPMGFLFGNNTDITPPFYKSEEEFLNDLGLAYNKTIKHFYDLGCRYIQIDDCFWGRPITLGVNAKTPEDFAVIDAISTSAVTVINLALKDLPADLIKAIHICRGNYQSDWFTKGGYDPITVHLAKLNLDAYFLEYDDERSGTFSPLTNIAVNGKNQYVVAGIITSKTPELEKEEAVIARITESAKYFPLERLCLSAQCGFASTEEGNFLTEDQQWAKIDHIVSIAKKVWGNL